MNTRPRSKEHQQLPTPTGNAEWRARDGDSDRQGSDGQNEPPQPIRREPKPDRSLLDNLSYAMQARLAFSPYLAGATMDAVLPYKDSEPTMPEPLAAARVLLQRAVLQRLLELQLLVEWPLLRHPCTPAQMERLLAGDSRPSELIGVRSGPPLEHPRLPPSLQGLCLLGPMDFAVALATAGAPLLQQQQLGKLDWMPLSQTGRGGGRASAGATAAAAGGGGQEGLMAWVSCFPRNVCLLPGLPAVASLPWSPPDLAWLRGFFRDLNPKQRHVGVDDRSLPWFRDIKVAAARAVVSEGSIRGAVAFAVFGVPHGERAAVWETALGLRTPLPSSSYPPPAAADAVATAAGGGGGISGGSRRAGRSAAGSGSGFGTAAAEDEHLRFERLCTKTLEQPMLLDLVVSEDVGPLVGDSEAFFLFEESIRAVLLAFQRDSQVATRLSAPPLAQLHASNAVHAVLATPLPPSPRQVEAAAADKSGGGADSSTAADGAVAAAAAKHRQQMPAQPYYPPSGVLPYRGVSLLAAPLCYIYDSTAASYHMFRALYCRYWSKLHSLSACSPPSPALPGLLRVFEFLMQELDPDLVAHLCRLGLLPAALVLPWIFTAFVGALSVQEVLLLWDRIIGLDSLLPLPLLAAAVLCFRRHVLLSCTSASEVVSALSDVTQLRAVPLLQAVLFPGPGSEA